MDALCSITREILDARLLRQGTRTTDQNLIRQFFALENLCVVVDPKTTPDDWKAKSFGLYIEEKALSLYADIVDAKRKAMEVKALLPDGMPMVMKIGPAKTQSIVMEYAQKEMIAKVWLWGRAPVCIKIDAQDAFVPVTEPLYIATRSGKPAPESETTIEPAIEIQQANTPNEKVVNRNFKLIAEIRQTLDAPKAAERKKLDPGDYYGNLSSLIGRLIQVNGIDPAELDQALDLNKGFTKNLCGNPRGRATPKRIVKAYLEFFGLSEYLYLFQKQSKEIEDELKASSEIDTCPIKHADSSKDIEAFELLRVQRAKDQANEAYIYRLEFKSQFRTVETVVSDPFSMVVGRKYWIEDLPPLPRPKREEVQTGMGIVLKNAADSSQVMALSEEDKARALQEIQKKEQERSGPAQRQISPEQLARDRRNKGRNRYIDETPEEKLERERNEVLGYIIKVEGCNTQDARRKMARFDDNPQTIESFAKWIKTGKPGGYSVRGYTPKRLMNQLRYSPLEAFAMMAELEQNPKETLQILKYRETDPQYQKSQK